jgi:NADH-quinone oxidoreductase subunit L
MSLLVLTDSIILFFLAWEGIGLCSYFLISYWGLRSTATLGATKVVIINRFADILLFITTVFFTYKLNIFYFSEISIIKATNQQTGIIIFFIFLTAACKSAQFPFTS